MHGLGYSISDPNYFKEKPIFVKFEAGYKLIWRYGKFGFFFTPECLVKKLQLFCSLQGTSSSGALTGKHGSIYLSKPDEVEAIKNNNSFWLEPDGSKIEIETAY